MHSNLGLDVSKVSDSAEFTLGEIFWAKSGKAYMYVSCNGTLDTVGDVAIIDENYDAAPITTTLSAPAAGSGLPCGVVVATMTDNQFGWVQVFGVVAAINVATSAAVHTRLNTTATAGRVDDDATAGAEVIEGLTTTAAEASNSAAGILNFPYVGPTL